MEACRCWWWGRLQTDPLEVLRLVARGGPTMLARIAVMKALLPGRLHGRFPSLAW